MSQYEQIVLGMMIASQSATAHGLAELDADCFSTPNFRIVFNAIQNLSEKEMEVNVYSVDSELKTMGQPLSLEELIIIEDKFYVEEAFNTLVDDLKDKKKKRFGLSKLEQIKIDLVSSNKTYEDIIQDINTLNLEIGTERQKIVTGKNYIEEREKHDSFKRTSTPIKTFMPEIDDNLTYGLGRGEISVIAARPRNCKSALKTNLIEKMASNGLGVASYGLEQTSMVESDRLESIVSGIPLFEVARNNLWAKNDQRWDMLKDARNQISSWPYYFVPGFNKPFNEIKNELRRLRDEGVSIVFFDLFDRIHDIVKNVSNKAQTVTMMLQRFLALANELNQHYCMLAQINRKVEDSRKKRRVESEGDSSEGESRNPLMPTLSDIKDSGGYEEVARTVFLLHYNKAYDRTVVEPALSIEIAKQNSGACYRSTFGFNDAVLKIGFSSHSVRGVPLKK